jgi:tripartite-type tricarboxylate transporter receptor subunit TctC
MQSRFKASFKILLTGTLMLAGAAMAQSFPIKPVSLMVPYPAGGPSDSAARVVSTPMSKHLGQQVLVENLGGASGTIAAQKVLAAPADGYYVFLGGPNEVILAPLANAAIKLRAEDFRLVQPMAGAVMVLVARKDLPANNVDELVTLARKSADKPLSYGSVGIGSLYHFMLEDVQARTKTQLTHVPYKGNAPLVQDLGGGQVDFAVLVYNTAMGALAEQGRMKILAQFGAQRNEQLSKVPTVAESKELKGMTYSTWSGFMVSKNTPEPVVQRLHDAFVKTLQEPAVVASLAEQAQIASSAMSSADATKYFESQVALYRGLAKQIGLQPQ